MFVIVKSTETLKTELQWYKLGYVLKDDAVGVDGWNNRLYKYHIRRYYDSEVEINNAKLQAYKAKINANRRQRRHELMEKRKEREKELYSYIRCSQYVPEHRDAIAHIEVNIDTWKQSIKPYRKLIIDTETTGLDPDKDEILQLSIIDDEGNTVHNKYYKPYKVKEWDAAANVNGIYPNDVVYCPHIYEDLADIQKILLSAKELIIYNAAFDLSFLESAGLQLGNVYVTDVMIEFARVYGEYSEYYGGYKWQKLTTAAAYYNYNWGNDDAHNGLSDCKAALHVYKCMYDSRAIEA